LDFTRQFFFVFLQNTAMAWRHTLTTHGLVTRECLNAKVARAAIFWSNRVRFNVSLLFSFANGTCLIAIVFDQAESKAKHAKRNAIRLLHSKLLFGHCLSTRIL